MVRQRVHYRGRVQGVGFRATTAMLSRDLPVGGYVRNLPDGRVELAVEGTAEAVERLLSRIAAEFAGQILETHRESLGPGEKFERFEIRY